MPNVVAIHGISQHQSGRQQLLRVWEPALRDGVELAVGRAKSQVFTFDIGFYGDLFLGAAGIKGGALEDLDEDELAFFADIEAEIVDQDPIDLKGFPPIPTRSPAWAHGSTPASALRVG